MEVVASQSVISRANFRLALLVGPCMHAWQLSDIFVRILLAFYFIADFLFA